MTMLSRLAKLIPIAATAAMVGCAQDNYYIPKVFLLNGEQYITGDRDCVKIQYEGMPRSTIQCSSTQGIVSMRGVASPSEVSQVEALHAQVRAQMSQTVRAPTSSQSLTQQEMQSLNQSIQQLGNSFNNGPQPQYNYIAPQVMPVVPPGGNQVRCIQAGIYTNCRY